MHKKILLKHLLSKPLTPKHDNPTKYPKISIYETHLDRGKKKKLRKPEVDDEDI